MNWDQLIDSSIVVYGDGESGNSHSADTLALARSALTHRTLTPPYPPMATDNFDPELRTIARYLPRAAVSRRSLGAVRLLTKLAAGTSSSVENETVGGISVRMYGPIGSEHPVPALLWIHGGGFVMGTAAQDDAACRHFAAALGIVVVAPEYRLAPEHQFPQPLHDCYEVLGWLSRQPYVDRTRIAVGGGSAGGGLAAALALLAHERGEIPLAFQLLAYPMLDDRTALRVDIDEHNFRMWNNKANRFGWLSYLGSLPGSAVSGLAAPARYEDLSGLPPAWIGVGTLDLFYDEDLAYADRLNSAGVPCELDEVPGAYHAFDSIRPKASVSRRFVAAQTSALSSALGLGTP